MRTFIFFLLFSLAFLNSFAQSGKIKREVTDADLEYLLKEVVNSFEPETSLEFSINTEDLGPLKSVKPEHRTTEKDVEDCKKKLNGTFKDFNTYNDLGNIYKKLNKNDEAIEAFNKAFEIITKESTEHPDDSLIIYYASLCVNAGDLPNAILNYEKSLAAGTKDSSTTMMMLPFLYIMSGDMEKAELYSQMSTSKYPSSLASHLFVTLYNLAKQVYDPQFAGDTLAGFSNRRIEDLADLSIIEKAAKNYPDSFSFQLLSHLSRQEILLPKFYKLFTKDKSKFFLTPYDVDQLNQLESFYLKSLKDPKIKKDYAYILNKALGVLYITRNEFDKAIKYLNAAIKIKTPQYSNFNSNPGEVFDLLVSAHMMKRDTTGAEAMLLKKIQVMPDINPLARNYAAMIPYYIRKNKLDLARTRCMEALVIDEKCEDAYVGLAGINLLEKNFEQAEVNIMKAYALNKEDEAIFTLSAIVYLIKKDYASAYYCLDKAIKEDSKWELPKKLMSTYFE